MSSSRLEAFSDGVLAIVITVMVLGLHVPEDNTLAALRHTAGPGLLAYLLSFVYIGIYWNNHHHMFQIVERVSGGALWANLHLLFWLSLVPFTTAWMSGQAGAHFARTPVAVYGVNMLLAAAAYWILQTMLIRAAGADSPLSRAVGRDVKGKSSPLVYLVGIACAAAFGAGSRVGTGIAVASYVTVALMWLVPDRRIARTLSRPADGPTGR